MDDKDSVVIDINNNSASAFKKYFCSYCNSSLFPLTQKDMIGAFVCTKCTITYWPNQQSVKKPSKFDLPGPQTDSHGNVIGNNDIPIASIEDPNEKLSSTPFKKQKLPAAYEASSRHGFKFVNYEER
jgi:DNA-directed RNA polymerase subunit M/transcription elongation factor TFIIS